MFKVIRNPEFSHDVPVMVPVDGGHREDILRARFRVLRADSEGFDPTTPDGMQQFLRASVVELQNLADEDGKPLAWNDDIRDLMFDMPYIRLALFKGYMAAVAKARLGN